VKDERSQELGDQEECYDVASHQSSEIKLDSAGVDQPPVKPHGGQTPLTWVLD
jgi:hypothetical protein